MEIIKNAKTLKRLKLNLEEIFVTLVCHVLNRIHAAQTTTNYQIEIHPNEDFCKGQMVNI